ncbi:hypothetical protein M408DRAFT_66922, partial [Serendipita vermifera MAFF 305830]
IYNQILNVLFPINDGFSVEPQYPLPAAQTPDVPINDCTVTYVITFYDIPVLLLEIKPPSWLHHTSLRASADKQIRKRFIDLFDLTTVPWLCGISALGTKFAVYEFDKDGQTVTPAEIPDSSNYVTDTAPIGLWDLDIVTGAGYTRLMRIADDIKAMVAELHTSEPISISS